MPRSAASALTTNLHRRTENMTAIVLLSIVALLPPGDLLVATDDLPKLGDALVVDARPAKEYAAGHIPGAVNLDVATLSEKRDGVKGLLKPLDQVKALLEQAGLDPARHIVIYGAMEDPVTMTNPSRMLWILEYLGYDKVSILDGGIGKWREEGRALSTEPVTPVPVVLPELKPRQERLAQRGDVDEFIKGRGMLLDLRPPEFYAGKKQKDYVAKKGHIPTAINLPPAELVTGPHHTYRPVEELAETLEKAGVKRGAPVVTYCNSGRSASMGYLVLRLTGHDTFALYDGSMAEWTCAGDGAVEMGE
jgi:thiosulfate/3-mercaptopyruvate sulfurtransferase